MLANECCFFPISVLQTWLETAPMCRSCNGDGEDSSAKQNRELFIFSAQNPELRA